MKRIPLIFCIMATAMIALTGCSTTSSDDADISIVSGTESSTTEESSSEPDSSADDSSSSESDSSSSAPENSSVPESGSSSAGNSTSSAAPGQSATSNASTPAAGTTSSAANTQKSAKERAQGVYAANELDIQDWSTPAVNLTAGLNQMSFIDEDGYILAFYNPVNASALTTKLKNQGFYDSRDIKIGAVKAFNDYRGVETDVINIQKLDSNMENYICYRYDADKDSFTEFFVPVNGSGSSTTGSSGSGSSNSSSSSSQNHPSTESDDLYEAIELVNEYREENGLPALTIESDLMDLAAIRAEELTESYSHERPDGTHVTSLGYAEIITIRSSAAKAIQSWKDSPDHNDILLSERYGGVGIGCYNDHWAMLFSKA